jgi:hypothetical protein
LRHLLFLVPFLVLLLAAGTTAVADLFSPRARGFVLGVIGVLLLVPVVAADVNDVRHPRRGDVTPLIREYSRSKSNGALIYVMAYEVPTWLFYTLRWDQRESASFRYAMSRANLTEHLPTRGCVRQSPGTRVVFGTLIDSGTAPRWSAAEARWIQAQPEREVWLLGDSFEFKNAGRMLDQQLIAQGARRTLVRTHRGTELRRYQSLRPSTTATAPSCEGSH